MPTLDDYKIVLYRQSDGSWVAYVPAIDGCHAIMESRNAVLDELQLVFEMICEEFEEKGQVLPLDKELVCA